jgi:uncharacterized protein YjiK
MLSVFLSGSCHNSISPPVMQKELILLGAIDLPFTEPSGITFSESMQQLWVVSGGTQHVYMLDTNGTVQKELPFTGNDLEGITFDETDSTLWVIDELTKEISHLNLDGTMLSQHQLTYAIKVNKGPEGITLGRQHTFSLVNEKDPSILIQLGSDFSIVKTFQLNFASDYSDIVYNSASDSFFILSDESNAFFQWSEQQGVICKFVLPGSKNEGIAYNEKRGIFYIVNDSTGQLFFYTIKN